MRGAATAAAALLSAFLVGLVVLAGGVTGDGSAGSVVLTAAQMAATTCAVSGPVTGLSAAQAANADLIVSAAMAAAPRAPGLRRSR